MAVNFTLSLALVPYQALILVVSKWKLPIFNFLFAYERNITTPTQINFLFDVCLQESVVGVALASLSWDVT